MSAATAQATIAVIEQFNDTWNARDIDGLMDLITDDCVFENTSPRPDGERFVGKAAIREVWSGVLQTPGMRFETEEMVASGDRVTTLWVYHWANADGSHGHIRGIDLFTVRDGKVAAKLSYVKG
ncbi:MAG: nuclear transport factor 2 family protein [Thermomicrobiales bacterium]|nr:nuclear transport factor 2 family protein [Thermomicrobiales bacterium]